MLLSTRAALIRCVLLFSLAPIAPAAADSYQCGEPFGPACPPVPMSPYESAGQVYGFNYLGLGTLDLPANGVPRGTILNKVVDSGATYIRTQISWRYGEPAAPTIDAVTGQVVHTYVDIAIKQAEHDDLQARGIKQIMVVMGTPYWALNSYDQGGTAPATGQCSSSSSAGNCLAPPNVDSSSIQAAWKAWIKHVLDLYPNIAVIEVWNEPNHPPFWGSQQNASLYARILATAADAAHEARPGIAVVIGGLVPSAQGTGHVSYLEAIYNEPSVQNAAGAYKFDAIGIHAYPCNERYSVPAPYAGAISLALTATRNVRDGYGDYDKPIWVTETGITSANVASMCGNKFNETEQRLGLAYALDWFKQENIAYGDVPVVIVHNLINSKNRFLLNLNSGDQANEFGLVAWAKNLLTGAVTLKDKPAYPYVRCKFKGTC